MRNRYFQAWGKIEAICLQNNIAEIYFMMDRPDLHFKFYNVSGGAFDIHRFPKQEVNNDHVVFANLLLPVGKSVNIRSIPRYTVKTKT